MLNLREIYRPKTLEEALVLLNLPGAVALAGGTELVASRRKDVRALVDLSGLGLAYIRDRSGAVVIGAATTLADIAESPILRATADGLVAQAAHRATSSLLRNQATVVGTLIAEPEGALAAALAAMEATVTIRLSPPNGEDRVGLIDFLGRREDLLKGSIVTEIEIPSASLGRRAAMEMVARTPSDKPIVTVCVTAEIYNGVIRSAAIALGGVGQAAVRAIGSERILLDASPSNSAIENAAREAINGSTPISDFRGSAEFRREMVIVLTARALKEIWPQRTS